MQLTPGIIIKGTEALRDSYFENATILITEVNEKGAVGFIINKPFQKKINALEEFKHLPPFPLFEGGPVDQEHLFFIHQRPDIIEGSTNLSANLYYGGNFKQATTAIKNNTISLTQIKVFIGYCGWDNNELNEEIKEGSWVMLENTENIFST